MLWLQFFPPLCTRWLGSGLGHLCRRVGRSFCSCWCPPLFRTIPAIGFTDGCTASGVKTTSSTFTTGTLHPSATGTLARDLDFGDPILVGPLIVPGHMIAFWLWLAWRQIESIEIHSGHAFSLFSFQTFSFYVSHFVVLVGCEHMMLTI